MDFSKYHLVYLFDSGINYFIVPSNIYDSNDDSNNKSDSNNKNDSNNDSSNKNDSNNKSDSSNKSDSNNKIDGNNKNDSSNNNDDDTHINIIVLNKFSGLTELVLMPTNISQV